MNFTHTHPPGSNYQINTQILSDIPDPQRVCALASVATVSAICFHRPGVSGLILGGQSGVCFPPRLSHRVCQPSLLFAAVDYPRAQQ